eukprot:208522_1
MALFMPQPKHYSKSRRKKRDRKSNKHKHKQETILVPKTDANVQLLDVNSIYREGQNGDLCKKHALVTVISAVLTERKVFKIHDELKQEQKDGKELNRKQKKKLRGKWRAQNFLSTKQYNKYCDKFDRINGFDIGISQKYFIIGKKQTDNIFSYILEQFKIKSGYITFDEKDGSIGTLLDIIKAKNVTKLIAFNFEHAWCYINIKDVWYEFDSMKKRSKPKPIKAFPYNCGYVYVYQ